MDTRNEYRLPLESVEAYVSGSWKCWGPANQDTEGDHSLHVVIYTSRYGREDLKNLRNAIMALPGTCGQTLPDPIISTVGNWSEPLAYNTVENWSDHQRNANGEYAGGEDVEWIEEQ